MAKPKAGEIIVFSWITYKSKAQRDRVNKKVMADPRLAEMMDPENMPFDMKRMAVRRVQDDGDLLSRPAGAE